MHYHEVAPQILNGEVATRLAFPQGTFIYFALVKQSQVFESSVNEQLIKAVSNCQAPPVLVFKTVTNQIIFGYSLTPSDIVANDWIILSPEQIEQYSSLGANNPVTPAPIMKVVKEEVIQEEIPVITPSPELAPDDAGINEPVEEILP